MPKGRQRVVTFSRDALCFRSGSPINLHPAITALPREFHFPNGMTIDYVEDVFQFNCFDRWQENETGKLPFRMGSWVSSSGRTMGTTSVMADYETIPLARPDIRQEDIDLLLFRAPIGYAGSGEKRFGARAGSKRVRESTLLCSGPPTAPPVCILLWWPWGLARGMKYRSGIFLHRNSQCSGDRRCLVCFSSTWMKRSY